MSDYLQQMTMRLAGALARLPEATRRRHGDFLVAAQRPDGGFAGREGDSDLYYTSFALRSLAMLGRLEGATAERAASYLEAQLPEQPSMVDTASLIYSAALMDLATGVDLLDKAGPDWVDEVVDRLNQLRRDDGGYAKSPQGSAGSTYQTFLVLLCRQLLRYDEPAPDDVLRFLQSHRTDEGGFLEIRVGKRAGVNPTAAAIGALRMLDAMDEPTRRDAVEFLGRMQTDEGGLRANTRIPVADLLSTFTGYLTLTDLNGAEAVDRRAMRRYVEFVESPSGGFFGASWDQVRDVEYTFYGLGCLALLSDEQHVG